VSCGPVAHTVWATSPQDYTLATSSDSMPAHAGIGIYDKERRPGRHPGGTQRLLLTVASSRIWRGSKDSAAPDPPGRPRRGYSMREGPSIAAAQRPPMAAWDNSGPDVRYLRRS
jgi:hypothetical protein